MQLGDCKFTKSKDLIKKWVHGEPKTCLQLLFVDYDSIFCRDMPVTWTPEEGAKTQKVSWEIWNWLWRLSTSHFASMEGMSLIRLSLLSWAAPSRTIGARAQMGPSKKELEAGLPPRKKEKVPLFILKGKQKSPWKVREYNLERRRNKVFLETKVTVVSKSDI